MAKPQEFRLDYFRERFTKLIWAFYFVRAELKKMDIDVEPASNLGAEARKELFVQILCDYICERVSTITVRGSNALPGAIATLVAKLARPRHLFEQNGIEMGISLAWIELTYEGRVLDENFDAWAVEMRAVDSELVNAQQKYRAVISDYAVFDESRPDPYETVMDWATGLSEYRRVNRKIQGWMNVFLRV